MNFSYAEACRGLCFQKVHSYFAFFISVYGGGCYFIIGEHEQNVWQRYVKHFLCINGTTVMALYFSYYFVKRGCDKGGKVAICRFFMFYSVSVNNRPVSSPIVKLLPLV